MAVVFDHVSLRVTNLERSVSFYRDVVGLEWVSQREDGSQAVFRAGEALLVLFCRPEYQPVNPAMKMGTDHVAFCLDEGAYDGVLVRLKEQGLVKRGPTLNQGAFGEGLATYFCDPDGHELEIKKYE
ncbi:MAG: VOC family protein [bacterium]|nr:VOC family protein [bacterium]